MASTRDTGDTPEPRYKKSSGGQKDERAYEDGVRNDYFKFEDSGNSNLFLQSEVRKVFGQRNPTLQNHDSLINTSDPYSPPLRSRRHEKMVPEAAPLEQNSQW